jgi:hypothetical protein
MNSNNKQSCSKLEKECNETEFFFVTKGYAIRNDEVFEKTDRGWELSNEKLESILLKVPVLKNLYKTYKDDNDSKFLLC